MEGVLRHGSAERMEYIRRFVAVLLALVLCMGLLRPPRVSAAAGSAAIAVTASVNPVAAVGVLLLALVGVAVAQEYMSSGVAGSAVYDEGQALMDVLKVDPECTAWYRTQQKFLETGGLKPGTKIEVPAHVIKAARNWAGETYDFSGGSVVVTQNGIYDFSSGSVLIFTQLLTTQRPNGSSASDCLDFVLGTVITGPTDLNFGNDRVISVEMKNGSLYINPNYFCSPDKGMLVFYRWNDDFCIGTYFPSYFGAPRISSSGRSYFSLSTIPTYSATGTLTSTDVFENPTYEDTTIALPGDIPSTVVDGLTVPVITTLDRDMILEGAGTIDPPIESDPPIVGDQTMVGDIALEDVAKEQESLGAVFISKFPFCIPWDMYHAVKLLAAPAKTPYWEIDFLAPISGRVGGWRGSTKVVIDMGEYEIIGQVSRWVSTILFCATLISGTKKLVWTG